MMLTDSWVTEPRVGPRRFCERLPEGAEVAVLHGWFTARSEPELHERFAWLKSSQSRQYFFRVVGLLNIFRHLAPIRRAAFIFCHAPHYFWWLLFLHRSGWVDFTGKRVAVFYFRSDSFMQRLDWWKEAPAAFMAYFASHEQVASLEERGCPPGRQGYARWRIDTAWYHPLETPTGGYFVVAGNIHRDEDLVIRLAKISPQPIIRVGQIGRLVDLYRGSGVKLIFNATHAEYRALIQNATAVLLPIEPCDEPAGLTATLEALACRVPVLANASLEVGSVLAQATGATPLPDLDLSTWHEAIAALAGGARPSSELLQRGRDYVVAQHSIPEGSAEWEPLFGSFASPTSAC